MSVLNLVEIVHDVAVTIRHDIVVLVELLEVYIGRDLFEHRTAECVHALMFEILGHERCNMQVAMCRLRTSNRFFCFFLF